VSANPLASPAVVGLLCDLVRIPSVNPTIAPSASHGEGEIAAFVVKWLEERGVRARLEEAAPGRPNAVGEVGNGGGPTLVLCAHLDTVGTAGMTIPPFEPRVENGRVYGRGAYDMKSGAAAVLSAVAALARQPPRGRILVALVADEEYASKGAEHFVDRHTADGCILTEGSEGKLILAHKGFVWADVVTKGRAAHGSRWDLGKSAIGIMGRILTALDDFDSRELRSRVHHLVGPASMHCALIEGGVGISTYAPECRVQIERRTLPGETPEGVIEELERIVRGVAEDARVELRFSRTPLLTDRNAAVARCVRESVSATVGTPPEETGVGYWMDAAVFAAAGIPSVNYGPAGAGAHEAIEWVDAESVVTCARVLYESAIRFLDPAVGAKGRSSTS
jgi:acetylornithine deacetylase